MVWVHAAAGGQHFSTHAASQPFAIRSFEQLSASSSLSFSLWSERERVITPVRAVKDGGDSTRKKGSRKPVSRRKESPWAEKTSATSAGGRRGLQQSSNGSAKSGKDAHKRRRADAGNGTTLAACASPRVLVSAVLPMETEVVLQTEEPATTPSWPTFVSSLRGVWRGVGAAFSPVTAKMEPIALGDGDEYLYDCRIYSTVEEVQRTGDSSIHRTTIWAVGNPFGELGEKEQEVKGSLIDESTAEEDNRVEEEDVFVGSNQVDEDALSDASVEVNTDGQQKTADLECQNLVYDSEMEADVLELEPGLVYFEDGSYSRGPVELLTGDCSDPALSTFKIEQCLVRGEHTRLRLVHTIAIEENGASVQLLRVAVYEEEWMGPSNMKSISDTGGHHLRLISQRERQLPGDLVGSWKVFEVSATAVLPEDSTHKKVIERPTFVYLSMETQKRRLLPEIPVHFADEDILDMQDATVLWLPGGITAYVDIKDDGMLTVGVGWYKDGVNLVMERDYNASGKLCEVHTRSEIKGGWSGGPM